MSEPQQKTEWELIYEKNLDKVRTSTIWGQDGTQIYVGNLIFEVIEDCKALLSQSNKNTLEEIQEKIPNEKIHILEDGVNSPHETEHDRGWNDYRNEVLSTLQELKGKI